MATSNRVFVSPGVYTSEKDLTFVAQSVGVTTLGMVGETLKGPAFEPVLITNFNEFRTYFGSTSPKKDGNGNPSYELPYFAKSYLQESNQLFVTRILGLTGYRPDKTYGIVTLGAPVFDSTSVLDEDNNSFIPTLTGMTQSSFYSELSGKTAVDGFSVTNYIIKKSYANGEWFTIGFVPSSATSELTASLKITGPIGDVTNFAWYNNFYNENDNEIYSYLFVYSESSGEFNVTRFTYDVAEKTYDKIAVAALRSRGSYVHSKLNLQITTQTGVTLNSETILTNPFGEFTITVTTDGESGQTHSFICSLNDSSTKYISKVLGTGVFDKNEEQYPLYVFESYPNLVRSLKDRGLIRGLSLTPVVHNVNKDFLTEWKTSASPYVVSEVRGGIVADLFRVISISDGDASNTQIKISIVNIDLETAEFDILVRDFYDTDDNIVALERFSRCSMNPDLPGYVALRIGTTDGQYKLRSKYIMLEMSNDHPVDAIPAGFRGFTAGSLNGGAVLGGIKYKTKYYNAGDIVRYNWDGTPVDFSGDKLRKVMLGLSNQTGYDLSLFKYKGDPEQLASLTTTPGFHLSSQASTITGSTITGFEFDCTPYDLEGQTGGDNNKLKDKIYRKFTLALAGGFDGWDIYRNVRTFGDEYKFGKITYDDNNFSNGGCFNDTVGNSDYYAYLTGIQTFANAEAVDINIFATPGINFYDHSSLTEESIDMVEKDRADSLYIISAPGYATTVDDIIGLLDTVNLDSNYSATYWPWIQIRDNENSTQLYIPPTGEVLRNIALTDNVSYPWFAVAGYSRGIVNAIKAYKKLTLDERDDLYRERINPIATFADTGPIIWGNKTLQLKESALDRINVRRLLLRARKLIAAVAVRLLFEQNDEQVRAEFTRLVNPILENIKKERGLYDFRLVVSNDPEDIDQNTLRGKIYIKPTRSLEFIDIEFIITPTGASFENI